MYVESRDTTDIVDNSSKLVLSAQNKRRAVSFCNPSTSILWLCKGSTATVGQGILLNALGGSYSDERDADGSIYTGIYSAIAVTSGSNVLSCQEDYFEN